MIYFLPLLNKFAKFLNKRMNYIKIYKWENINI